MKISKPTKYITLAFAVLAALVAASFLMADHFSGQARQYLDEKHTLSVALQELSAASVSKTRLMRVVAVTGNNLQYTAYHEILETDWQKKTIDAFNSFNAPEREIELLEEFFRRQALMDEISSEVFRLRFQGDYEAAINLAHSREFAYLGTPLGPKIEELLSMVYNRTTEPRETALRYTDIFAGLCIAFSIALLAAVLFSVLIAFSLRISNLIRVLAVALLGVSVANLIFVTGAAQRCQEAREALNDRHTLISAVYDLGRSTETLTRISRMFVVTQGEIYWQAYHRELERGIASHALDVFVLSGAPDSEMKILVDSVNRHATLRNLELSVMQERIAGVNTDVLVERVFGQAFVEIGFPMNALRAELREMVNQRTNYTAQSVYQSYQALRNLSLSFTIFMFLVGVTGSILKFRRGVTHDKRGASALVTKIQSLGIKVSLYASFGAIILIFGAQIGSNAILAANIRRLNQYNIDFALLHSEVVLEFHQEFTEMRRILANSFLSPTWLETADAALWSSFENRLTASYNNLNRLAEIYKNSIANDPLFPQQENDLRIYVMSTVMGYARDTYKNFADNFFLNSNMTLQQSDIDYTESAEIMLGVLRRLHDLSQDVVADNIERYSAASLVASVITFVFAFLVASLLAYLAVRRFDGKMKRIRESASMVMHGDFRHVLETEEADEISQLFKEIVATLANVVDKISQVVTSHADGDVHRRIDAGPFGGSSLAMVLSVNQLLDTVNESVQDLRLAEERSNVMLNGNPIACFLVSESFEIVDCNNAATVLLGYSSKEETLQKSPEVFAARGADVLEKILKSTLEGGHEEFDWELMHPKGHFVPVRITLVRFDMKDKRLITAYVQDVSAVREMMEKQQLVDIAQENSMAKSKFLARMSHEIRTPLTAVLGIAEIQMHSKDLSPQLDEAFSKIYSSASALLGIVNDILDLSKIEAGKMDIADGEYDSASLFSDVAQLNLAYLGSKRLDFVVDIDENVPALLKGDELRIKQVMNNVLSNAFKYTDAGRVNLSVRVENGDLAGFVNLVITVEDTGRGMSESQLQALFDDYIRFHSRNDTFDVGTGLGMSITHGLLARMNGTIAVSSDVGSGTSVVIVLPQMIASAQTLGKATSNSLKNFSTSAASTAKRLAFKPEPMPGGRVLVVDDVDANIYVAKGLLDLYSISVDTCTSGKMAIDRVADGNIYDVIFMDQMMPEMTGMEATAKIREMGYIRPIVALTANALVGQADEFLKSGFDGFLSKPIQTAHLNAILHKFVKAKHSPRNDGAAAAENKDIESFFDNHMRSSGVMEKVARDFLAGQKYVVSDINFAHSTGDTQTAERLSHTLKGLAALIGEGALSATAAQAEKTFREGGDPTEIMSRLSVQLVLVLTKLSKDYPEEAKKEKKPPKPFDKAFAEDVFGRLEELLKKRSFDATEIVGQLAEIPETEELVTAVQRLEFRQALKILADLQEKLGL
ncbi:MAG: ATP-binding protein [Defluviitaleaceae bacterium]|nr:ATP-binding protein [Defluviitaleaceae bacterium]